jgi:hypothetical protein
MFGSLRRVSAMHVIGTAETHDRRYEALVASNHFTAESQRESCQPVNQLPVRSRYVSFVMLPHSGGSVPAACMHHHVIAGGQAGLVHTNGDTNPHEVVLNSSHDTQHAACENVTTRALLPD